MPTVTGTAQDVTRNFFAGTLTFQNLSAPLVDGDRITCSAVSAVVPDPATGAFSIELAPGNYTVTASGLRQTSKFTVPEGTGTYLLSTLLLSATTVIPGWLISLKAPESGSYRLKEGVLELWNADQAAWFPVSVSGAAGSELLSIGAKDATSMIEGPIDLSLSNWARLLEIAAGDGYELSVINRDSDGLITTATVHWPDGSAGVFTTTLKNSTFLTVDAYTVTHATSGRTITQAAVTRDSNGSIVTKPILTLS